MFLRLVIPLLMLSAQAQAEFKNGNTMYTSVIEGVATVRCDGFNGNQTAVYNCRDVVLEPSQYDFFVGPKIDQAVKVNLKALHEDGSTRNKSERYLGSQGISQNSFNLWVASLFQRPLLEFGQNLIGWELVDISDAVLDKGQFAVTIAKGSGRKCEPMFYNSSDANDCNSQFTVCQRFFQQSNYCK